MAKAVFFDWFNTLACYDPPREEMHAVACRYFGIEVEPEAVRRGLMPADQLF